jgi:hypothetical protein
MLPPDVVDPVPQLDVRKREIAASVVEALAEAGD